MILETEMNKQNEYLHMNTNIWKWEGNTCKNIKRCCVLMTLSNGYNGIMS